MVKYLLSWSNVTVVPALLVFFFVRVDYFYSYSRHIQGEFIKWKVELKYIMS